MKTISFWDASINLVLNSEVSREKVFGDLRKISI
jgi:hypothetical protein